MPKQMNRMMSTKQKRMRRVRAKLHGTAQRPRVTVFRSNKHIYLQAIDDDKAVTIVAAGEHNVKVDGIKTAKATAVAAELAARLKKAKVAAVVFDRGSYQYHGRVKAVAEALREAGIQV